MEIAWPICRQENWSRTRSMTCQSSSVDLAQGIRRTAILLFLWDQERRWLILSSQAQSDVLGRYDEIEVCWSCAMVVLTVGISLDRLPLLCARQFVYIPLVLANVCELMCPMLVCSN